ncbi:MAG: PAS domain S-box protein [Firmicutes bacterium]|nr:PAS domain S-box protein [Bacillota bacterium]
MARDPKEYNRTEETIKAEEKKLRSITSALGEGVFEVNAHGQLTFMNPEAEHLLGWTEAELFGKDIHGIIHCLKPDGTRLPPERCPILKVIKEGTPVRIEDDVFIRKDGSALPVAYIATPIIEDGKVTASVVAFQDITERKQAEEKILRLNRLYSVLSKINQAIVRTRDPQELYKQACRIAVEYGLFKMAWVGIVDPNTLFVKPVAWYGYDGEYLDKIKISIRADIPEGRGPTGSALREGRYFINNDTEHNPAMLPWRDEMLKRGYKSSASFPLIVRGRVVGAISLYAGEVNFFTEEEVRLLESLANDLSFAIEAAEQAKQRRQAIEELRRSEARLAEAQRVAHMGSWEWDIRTNKLTWSDEIYRIFGLTPEEFGATYDDFLKLVHPEDREFVKKAVNEALFEHKPYSIDHRVILPDGTERVVHEQAEVVLDEAGKPLRMIGTVQDITERKRIEEELEQSREQVKRVYADAMAAVTGDLFILCTYEDIGRNRRGTPVYSQFVARAEEIGLVRNFLGSILKNRRIKPERIFEIQVSVEEALVNSIKHAGGGRVEIRANNVLQVEIADSGPGIDFSVLPRSVLLLGFSTKGTLGFGFNIMLEFADHLYLATGPAGTIIILEYNLRPVELGVKGYYPYRRQR